MPRQASAKNMVPHWQLILLRWIWQNSATPDIWLAVCTSSTSSLCRSFLCTTPCCWYRFSWKAISTYMSLSLARLCGEWRLVRTHNFRNWKIMLSESRWRRFLGKQIRWRNRKAVEEIGKPLKKIFSDFLEMRKPLKKIKLWARKIGSYERIFHGTWILMVARSRSSLWDHF